MSNFEALHPRAGGTGPDRTQFAAKEHGETGLSLDAPAVLDIETAPKDGEVIEALSDGQWREVFWSESADDGSPYGTEGWKTLDHGMVLLDPEGWREPAAARFVDEEAASEWMARHDAFQIENERLAAEAEKARSVQSPNHPFLGHLRASFGAALLQGMRTER